MAKTHNLVFLLLYVKNDKMLKSVHSVADSLLCVISQHAILRKRN